MDTGFVNHRTKNSDASLEPECETLGMVGADLSEPEYLRHIEYLARELVYAAADEGWLTYGDQLTQLTPLQRAVTEIAHQIRHYHFDGDGCIDPELPPTMKLAGTVILKPGAIPLGTKGTYAEICTWPSPRNVETEPREVWSWQEPPSF
ncbi:hypothetical protein [Sphaerisporangium perillae]|uniref:hypothetical protein n=1 Tax=Sphaerisporangium perillae TaxID=2935860 RepID=UPI00200FCE7F|nr:hypothetical protein [Sphaerisporangium perillae]